MNNYRDICLQDFNKALEFLLKYQKILLLLFMFLQKYTYHSAMKRFIVPVHTFNVQKEILGSQKFLFISQS